MGTFGREHYEEHFCEIILNLDQLFRRCLVRYILSRALVAILVLVSLTTLLEWQLCMYPCVLYVRMSFIVYTGETNINYTLSAYDCDNEITIIWALMRENLTLLYANKKGEDQPAQHLQAVWSASLSITLRDYDSICRTQNSISS